LSPIVKPNNFVPEVTIFDCINSKFIVIYVNIFLEIALYLTGIVYLIILLLLTELVFLKTDLINFGEIKRAILNIQPT